MNINRKLHAAYILGIIGGIVLGFGLRHFMSISKPNIENIPQDKRYTNTPGLLPLFKDTTMQSLKGGKEEGGSVYYYDDENIVWCEDGNVFRTIMTHGVWVGTGYDFSLGKKEIISFKKGERNVYPMYPH